MATTPPLLVGFYPLPLSLWSSPLCRKRRHPPTPANPWKRQGLYDRQLLVPLLPRQIHPHLVIRSGAVCQSSGASRAPYSRWHASFVAVERSLAARRPNSVVVIEHASTSFLFLKTPVLVVTLLSSRTTNTYTPIQYNLYTASIRLFPPVFSTTSHHGARHSPSLSLLFTSSFLGAFCADDFFGMDRPCARRRLVCEYPAESYRGRRSSGPKATPVKPQRR
jgi:hypothetical protein